MNEKECLERALTEVILDSAFAEYGDYTVENTQITDSKFQITVMKDVPQDDTKDLLAHLTIDADDNKLPKVEFSKSVSDSEKAVINNVYADFYVISLGETNELVFDLIESADFKLIKNNDGTIDVYDNGRDEIAAEDVSSPSVAVEALGVYGGDILLDGLEKDALNAGISNIPQTGEEWKNAVTRPDLQEFIEGHRTEVAEVLLITDPDKMNSKVDLKDIADMFGSTEITKSQEDMEF